MNVLLPKLLLAVASYPKKINTNTRIVKSFSCLVLVEKKRLDGKTKHVYEFCLAITLGDQWTTNHRANLHSSLNDFISFANRNAIKLSLVWPQTFHVTQIPRH